MTTVSSDTKGHQMGDLVIILDEDLARRMYEFVRRMTDCDDGRRFDDEHGLRKRAGVTTGQAL
jgi:Mn-dependent DtxR family transcriptional regulator